MAQHDYVIANDTGAIVRADINDALAAIVSLNSGASAPSTTFAHMLWYDSTTNVIKKRNAANTGWITVGTFFDSSGRGVFAGQGHISGLTLSNNATDTVNDIDIASGVARDSTDAHNLVLTSTLTKRLDASWVVGTNQGGLDTGTIANNTYHIHLIRRSDTGVVDALFSLSATSPTMPTSYDQRRRIGSITRESGSIVQFVQTGNYFARKSPALDVNATNPGTSAVTRTLSVPTGIRLLARVNVLLDIGAADGAAGVLLSDLSVTDNAPSLTAAPLCTIVAPGGSGTQRYAAGQVDIHTNTSGQIRSRLSASGAATVLRIATLGWFDARDAT